MCVGVWECVGVICVSLYVGVCVSVWSVCVTVYEGVCVSVLVCQFVGV